jgi:hypothetical protein
VIVMVPEEEEGEEAAPAELSLTEQYKHNLRLAAEAYVAGLNPDEYFGEDALEESPPLYESLKDCAEAYEGVSKSALTR